MEVGEVIALRKYFVDVQVVLPDQVLHVMSQPYFGGQSLSPFKVVYLLERCSLKSECISRFRCIQEMECVNSVVGSVIKVFDWVFNPASFCHGITQILILPKYSKDLLSGVKLRIFFPEPVNGLIGSLLRLVWPEIFLFGFGIYQLEHLLDFTLRLRQLLLVVQQRIGLPGAALVGLACLKALLHDGHKCMWPMLEVRHQPLLLSRIRFHICTYHEVSQPFLRFLKSYIAELRQLVISKLLKFQFTEKMIHFISLPRLQIVGITA